MRKKRVLLLILSITCIAFLGCGDKEPEIAQVSCKHQPESQRDACCFEEIGHMIEGDCEAKFLEQGCQIQCLDKSREFCGYSLGMACDEDTDCITDGCHGYVCTAKPDERPADEESDQNPQVYGDKNYREEEYIEDDEMGYVMQVIEDEDPTEYCEDDYCMDPNNYGLSCKCVKGSCDWA